jgi:hypothetical protein
MSADEKDIKVILQLIKAKGFDLKMRRMQKVSGMFALKETKV